MVRLLLVTVAFFSSVVSASQDPTAPLGWQKPREAKPATKIVQQPVPMLQSIVCRDAGHCRAVLNNQVALVGETVNGYKVTSIEPELVRLSRAGKQWELELFTLDIKQ
ncbi:MULTISPECIES: hypothetical protein [Vibrio]|uniref:hypothetical protein n=1 Tax=Vibrio TaxID=662 RepID=UPI0001B94FDD|nr:MULTISPECIES: hypothetical protein [Vibrio]MCM5511124.1 MSHA biogenesis protein MshK [Vibrio sp. SCSIO 43169]EEX34944.1 MSHA biogenesis protein MshK [Vibrio coralliilyticus ATCC BAA-450]MDE3898262.1 MSHA biogenesis protein MshK [Vibrio sp. CC007]NRF32645.1 MSHA biogenesis protein MshK [Vibrio coralliilyticus]NRF54674.1 MSHA biogenesis protein MshK [Vibrio coralliilyticus]